MTAESPAAARDARGFTPARFAIRVGQEWSPIRAAAIWPIADVLATGPGLATALPASASSTTDVALVLDLIDSGMIAPPQPRRRRRERSVSSRAVFYQATDA